MYFPNIAYGPLMGQIINSKEEAEVPEELEALTPHWHTVLHTSYFLKYCICLYYMYVSHGPTQHGAKAHNPVCEEVGIVT